MIEVIVGREKVRRKGKKRRSCARCSDKRKRQGHLQAAVQT